MKEGKVQMTVFDIWKSLKKGDIHPVYCLYGKETYLLQETVQRIRQAVVDEETKDFNLSVFDLEEEALDLAVEDAETFPFMGDKRLVVAKNPSFLTAEKRKIKRSITSGAWRIILRSRRLIPFLCCSLLMKSLMRGKS